MLIQFTLQELMLFLISALGIVAGMLLLPILWNIKKIIGILRPQVEASQEIINQSIIMMPGILENVEQISSNVRETTDHLKISAPVILQEVEFVTTAAKGNLALASVMMENIGFGVNTTIAAGCKKDATVLMDYIHIFEEILQIIYRNYSAKQPQ